MLWHYWEEEETCLIKHIDLRKIQKFVKLNYQEMYLKWSAYSQQGFYGDK